MIALFLDLANQGGGSVVPSESAKHSNMYFVQRFFSSDFEVRIP